MYTIMCGVCVSQVVCVCLCVRNMYETWCIIIFSGVGGCSARSTPASLQISGDLLKLAYYI